MLVEISKTLGKIREKSESLWRKRGLPSDEFDKLVIGFDKIAEVI